MKHIPVHFTTLSSSIQSPPEWTEHMAFAPHAVHPPTCVFCPSSESCGHTRGGRFGDRVAVVPWNPQASFFPLLGALGVISKSTAETELDRL